ncbi:MAG: hypothetical protein EOP84_17725 [Verrucomicrobiaceae bacterium]|nr:MAG: hypothetical protein EOP84_17725 [Verrucomicrobiaceae bacterium]
MKYSQILADECETNRIVFAVEEVDHVPAVFEKASEIAGFTIRFTPQDGPPSEFGSLTVEGFPTPFTPQAFTAIKSSLEQAESVLDQAEEARIQAVKHFKKVCHLPLGSEEPSWTDADYR